MNRKQKLAARLTAITAAVAAIEATLTQADRLATDDERKQLTDLNAEFARVRAEQDLLATAATNAAALEEIPERAVAPTGAARPAITGGERADARDPLWGFGSVSNYFKAIRDHANGRGRDERLMNAVTTYGQEGIGSDGGFAALPAMAETITRAVMGEASLLPRLKPITIGGNQFVEPTDESTPWGGSGIIAEWLGEAGAFTQRKPSLKQLTTTAYKVGSLVPVTEELLADAPAMQSYLVGKIADAITAKVNEALVAGNGIAKPLGFLNAPGIVTQAKSGATLAAVDVLKMKSRLLSTIGAFWVGHSTFFPNLLGLTVGNQAMFLPNMTEAPTEGMILGLPAFASEYCSDYNVLGDVFVVQPDGYRAVVKSMGAKNDVSAHFFFDQAVEAFRSYVRVGGQPLLSAAVARKNGSQTLSHVVNLQVRS